MKYFIFLFSVISLVGLSFFQLFPDSNPISSKANGEVIKGIKADLKGVWLGLNGEVDNMKNLEKLVLAAWGNGRLGLHRGHAAIENVLVAFLGISHEDMHVLMEDYKLNLAATCDYLQLPTNNLIITLTMSFEAYVDQAVKNKVITLKEKPLWMDKIKENFSKRVYWQGND